MNNKSILVVDDTRSMRKMVASVLQGAGYEVAEAGDRVIPVWVREISDQSALLDANHPLAGHTLIFEIELVSFHS